MTFGLNLITAPACEPLTLTDAKDHLRVTYSDEDLLIESLITAARIEFEALTYRQLITATYDLVLDGFPRNDLPIRIPRAPLQSVTSITYTDPAGDAQTLDSANYIVSATRLPGIIRPAYGCTWPTARTEPDAVTVRFLAGHGEDPDDVESLAKAAIRLLIGQYYEFREEVIDRSVYQLPKGAARIIQLYDLGDELLEYGAVGTLV